jgi:hypothetical protein
MPPDARVCNAVVDLLPAATEGCKLDKQELFLFRDL